MQTLPVELNEQAIGMLRFRMIRVFSRMLGNREDALEVAQEAFLRYWKTQRVFTSCGELNSWIFRIGLNAAKDFRKSAWKRRIRAFPVVEPQAHHQAVAEILIGKEEKMLLSEAIEHLREEEREVFLLRKEGGLTFEEIAQAVQRPSGTVKTQFRTALSKLRLTLGKDSTPHPEPMGSVA